MGNDKKIFVNPIYGTKNPPDCIHRYGLWCYPGNSSIAEDPFRMNENPFEKCQPRIFQVYSISHMIEGQGKLWIRNKGEFKVRKGDCILMVPGVVNRYGGIHGYSYIEDTLCFNGPVADMMLDSGVISCGVFPLGNVRRLIPLINSLRDASLDSVFSGLIRLQQLLMEIFLSSHSAKTCAYPFFDTVVENIRAYPEKWWSVEELAEMCRLSTPQLRRVFLLKMGISPKQYIDRVKSELAAEQLRDTRKTVHDIARSLGYADPYHFSRRFKQVVGNSPLQYRDSFNREK